MWWMCTVTKFRSPHMQRGILRIHVSLLLRGASPRALNLRHFCLENYIDRAEKPTQGSLSRVCLKVMILAVFVTKG